MSIWKTPAHRYKYYRPTRRGRNFRRNVGVVLLEITTDEWENMYDWAPFLQTAGPELATAAQTFTAGHFPRSNLLVKLFSQGAPSEWVNQLAQ